MLDSTSYKIPKLKGSSNYDIWALRIAAILSEKDLEFVMKCCSHRAPHSELNPKALSSPSKVFPKYALYKHSA